MQSRSDALDEIFSKHGEAAIYVTNTGYMSRAVYDIKATQRGIFYMQGSMGLSPAIALGIALNTEREVVALVGDASLLMHLGITHTIRDYKNKGLENLYVYILDNGCHESVGAYKSSHLEDDYVGVDKIYKISCDGKLPRVGVSFKENIEELRKGLSCE